MEVVACEDATHNHQGRFMDQVMFLVRPGFVFDRSKERDEMTSEFDKISKDILRFLTANSFGDIPFMCRMFEKRHTRTDVGAQTAATSTVCPPTSVEPPDSKRHSTVVAGARSCRLHDKSRAAAVNSPLPSVCNR